MRLDPQAQLKLLELAELERATVAQGGQPQVSPAQQELQRQEKLRERQVSVLASAKLAVSDMEAEILRIQEDERKLRARERDDKRQLTAETDPERRRDLEHDRYAAKSRIADLMGELMECHNEIHPLRDNVERLSRELEQIDERVRQAREQVAEEGPVASPETAISERKKAFAPEVIAAYESRRSDNEVGVARFNGRSCLGCFMVLPAADRARVAQAAPDVLPECPNCGSYLVRVSA
ncbi:Zn-ribbon protein [Corynebacterium atypicum]|uniref:Zn-ribbon protein n=1 Tax=Corynebacterium atypicum TaxID=191610 RepID=A0ABN4DDH8_9CORY|nr:C4-type zinc ribbon domain-containing protein [Corynebacterium atypicum]AIG64478.1 Zn-ribbon protein [Corynebacterium atypicum]